MRRHITTRLAGIHYASDLAIPLQAGRRVIKAIDTGAIADEDKEKNGREPIPDTPADNQVEIFGGIEKVIAMNKRSRDDREKNEVIYVLSITASSVIGN
ncbi:hypothetical protein WG66_001011 [Moniliophthora roreri]|nr:hypothetical protein WG66_001011 [Moniliophthora roreri]